MRKNAGRKNAGKYACWGPTNRQKGAEAFNFSQHRSNRLLHKETRRSRPERKGERGPGRAGRLEEGEEASEFSENARLSASVMLPGPLELEGGRPIRKSADVQGPFPYGAARPPSSAYELPIMLPQPSIRIHRCAYVCLIP